MSVDLASAGGRAPSPLSGESALPGPSGLQRALRWVALALVAVVWVSSATFGLYMLAFYGGSLASDDLERWNELLPLRDPERPQATFSIAVHFLGGAILLVLGPVQFIERLRTRWIQLHRWIGRLFVLASALAAVGGLSFIALHGTVGGLVMDLGFGLYGLLMLWATIETFRHVRAGRISKHRAWGIRLFVLVIASWLYRIEYGFWFLAADFAGHTKTFSGPFDDFMAFAFYLPNLAVAELYLRADEALSSPKFQALALGMLSLATLLASIGTYAFIREAWGPEIRNFFFG